MSINWQLRSLKSLCAGHVICWVRTTHSFLWLGVKTSVRLWLNWDCWLNTLWNHFNIGGGEACFYFKYLRGCSFNGFACTNILYCLLVFIYKLFQLSVRRVWLFTLNPHWILCIAVCIAVSANAKPLCCI